MTSHAGFESYQSRTLCHFNVRSTCDTCLTLPHHHHHHPQPDTAHTNSRNHLTLGHLTPLLPPSSLPPLLTHTPTHPPPRSCIPWHSDNESLFGPPSQPKLIVSMSLGHSVEFQVRYASCDVPSSITRDRGDLLVMDGLAQSEYAHRTVPGLQGPRVNLTYRWVTRHTASCPLAGVVGCVLPTCVEGLAEPGSRGDGLGENKWSSFLVIGPPFVNPGVFPPGSHFGFTSGGGIDGCQRPSRSAAYFPLQALWVGERPWQLSRRRQSTRKCLFISLLFFCEKTLLFF